MLSKSLVAPSCFSQVICLQKKIYVRVKEWLFLIEQTCLTCVLPITSTRLSPLTITSGSSCRQSELFDIDLTLDEECTWIDKLMPSEYLILLSYPIMLEIPVPSFDMCWPLNLFFLSSFVVNLKSLIWFEQKTSTYKKQTIKSEKSLWSGNYLFKVKATCSIKSNRFDSWLILKNNTWLLLKGLHQFVKPITPPLDSAFCTLEVKAAAAAEPAPNVFCTCQKLEPLTVIQHLFWTLD